MRWRSRGPEARGEAHRRAIDVAADVPSVHGDRVQLQQVVLNLVRNAVEAIAERAAGERPHRHIGAPVQRLTARSRSASPTTAPASRPTRRAPVRAADDLEGRRAGPRPVDLRLDRAGAWRPHLAAIERGPARPSSASRCRSKRAMTADHARDPTVFVIDDQEAVRHALGEMLSVFGFDGARPTTSADSFLAARTSRSSAAASSPTCACPAWTASSWCASWRGASSRCRWC